MATTTTDFYLKSTDGWVQIATAADLNIIKGPRRRPWSLYAGASPPSTSDTPASANLSYTGRPVAATKAVGTLTLEDETGAGQAVVDGDTVKIGDQTYTFKTTPAIAYDVQVAAGNVANAAALVAIINSGNALTAAHPTFEASAASRVVTITALLNGTAVNAVDTIATSAGMAFGAATPVDGVAGEIITLAGSVYRFATTLSAPLRVAGNLPGEVQIGANSDGDYANLTAAVNGSGTPGTTYGIGTTAHPSNIGALAIPGSDDVLFTAGPGDNGIAVSEGLTNAAFDGGVTALAGGAPAPRGMTFGTMSFEDNHEMALPNVDGNVYARVLGGDVFVPSDAPLHFSVIAITSA